MNASMRYLNQRYSMPFRDITGILTDVGTEELAHLEMIASILHQLTRNLSEEKIAASPFAAYFIDHTTGVYPAASSGYPDTMSAIAIKGDALTDLNEDLAAEQKARTTYDNILRLVDDPDVRDPIQFLRAREVVHYQRFGETKRELSNKSPNAKSPHPRNHKRINNVSSTEIKPARGLSHPKRYQEKAYWGKRVSGKTGNEIDQKAGISPRSLTARCSLKP